MDRQVHLHRGRSAPCWQPAKAAPPARSHIQPDRHAHAAAAPGTSPAGPQRRQARQPAVRCRAAAVADAPAAAAPAAGSATSGHTALLHGLGDVGDVAPAHLPWLLRLAHVRFTCSGADSSAALAESARGLLSWRCALERGLLPDDEALAQLAREGEACVMGRTPAEAAWPEEPLRGILIRGLSRLGVARFAQKYPAVREALLRSLLEVVLGYARRVAGEVEEVTQRPRDSNGNEYKTVAELAAEERARRASRAAASGNAGAPAAPVPAAKAPTAAAAAAAGATALPPEKRAAVELVKELYLKWQAPIDALAKAGRAFEGLEALLGGDGFDLTGNIWRRQGWAQMDELRKKLENLRELRDLVRSLGRGGGWGPLRRAPTQHLSMSGRPGLLRTVLEAQETRGLTRSDDISRLLPAEAALLARGRTSRQAKLLFFAKLAEKALQTYERDGWGDFPTVINPDRREIRPTADRGPILLCVDTSGSMRGPRETVAKALALECMRAAREQERGCYVFAFSGPQEVRELELNDDMRSVNNLLEFLEKVFNGGSDFNEPVRRCLDRVNEAAWANSDILLVSDGELRQPGPEVMRKLSGAKEKLGLRVHGLIVGAPDKARADPAVLRSLCTNILPNGKTEMLVSRFEGWASVQADEGMQFDWDDVEGNTRRRLAGLAHEKARKEEEKRLRLAGRGGRPKSAQDKALMAMGMKKH